MVERLLAGSEASPAAPLEAKERARLLEVVMAELTEPQQRLVRLRYQGCFTFGRIAAEFAVSVPAVHAMHMRAIVRMRSLLARRGITRISHVI